MEKINISDLVNMTALRRLVKIYNETNELTKFIQKVVYEYEPVVDKMMAKYMENMASGMFCDVDNPNRPLFSEETTRKIMGHMEENLTTKEANIANE